MLTEVLAAFEVFSDRSDLSYFDGTYGRGGHFRAIQQKFQPRFSCATDQDEAALSFAREEWKEPLSAQRMSFFHQNFCDFIETAPLDYHFDMALLDLGVSSPQLDQAERGFSFNKEGPLDMRMNRKSTLTAADIINTFSEDDLYEVFRNYGEIQNPARVIRALLKDRGEKKFESTLQLASLIERVDGWKKKGFHPATQYFMALRLVVNRELEVIERVLPLLIDKMQDKGRIAVITFHSLEDRIVKNIFRDSPEGFLVNKKVIVPSEEECRMNVRARSAKLRIFQKGSAPEKPDKFAQRRAQRGQ
jgi:16S rRNA (cytosine1402-N4)-methyltransferase